MDTRMRRAGVAVICAGFLALAGGWGQPGPATKPTSAPTASTPVDDPKPRTTVTDLARAYLELEAAFFAAPVERELCREVNTAFDEASMLFFAGNLARVVEIVDASATKIRAAASLPMPDREVVIPWKLDPKTFKAEGSGFTISCDKGEAPFVAIALADGLESSMDASASPARVWKQRRAFLDGLLDCTNPIGNLVLSRQELASQIYSEWLDIDGGTNPYINRRGDIWRPYFIDEQPAPMRLFCPEHREPPAAGWPLVIALHGAGGNEHMFMAGYGVGRIKQLAEEHGFIVASPLNSPLSAQPAVFDALIDSIAADYSVDRSRVYLIGHSMGAGVALAWSKLRTDKVAASALIAGVGRFNARDKLPPTLLIAPELDGLIPAKSIMAAAEQAKAFGLPVECREIKDYGHTLVVGYILPEVVEWLLKQPPSQSNAQPPATPGVQP